MTTTQHIQLAPGDVRTFFRLVARLAEPALAVLLLALVTVAWLALFTYIPFDFTPYPGR